MCCPLCEGDHVLQEKGYRNRPDTPRNRREDARYFGHLWADVANDRPPELTRPDVYDRRTALHVLSLYKPRNARASHNDIGPAHRPYEIPLLVRYDLYLSPR